MSVKVDGFKSSPLLAQISSKLEKEPGFRDSSVKAVKGVIIFTVKNKKGKQQSWKLDLKEKGTLTAISSDEIKNYDTQIITSDVNLKKLINGKAGAQSLFLSGRLKLKGNIAKAASIESVFKDQKPKL